MVGELKTTTITEMIAIGRVVPLFCNPSPIVWDRDFLPFSTLCFAPGTPTVRLGWLLLVSGVSL